jgi:aspartate-semialdehyde dehydrogenase
VSFTFAPIFAKLKTLVIDNSAAWRMDKNVPLVVPEVNPEAAKKHQFIIANPNCSTIQAVVALKPLHDAYQLKRMVIATYQAVSGAGSKGLHDLVEKLPTGKTTKFPYQIYENVIPHIDIFLDNGNTKEEEKIIHETRKIMGIPNLPISSTAVRVPVKNGHSEAINLEFEKPFQLEKLIAILKKAPGVIVEDDPSKKIYPMPLLVDGKDEVYVGRIRRDDSIKNGLNLFVVGDNIRKGAATNAIQILELFIK